MGGRALIAIPAFEEGTRIGIQIAQIATRTSTESLVIVRAIVHLTVRKALRELEPVYALEAQYRVQPIKVAATFFLGDANAWPQARTGISASLTAPVRGA